MSIENEILNYLRDKETWVFCIKDMLIFGEYKSVAKAIERLTIDNNIKRVIQGVYYYPLINKLFNVEYPPEIDDIAGAISRNNGWEIRETGSSVLRKFGLDNQISNSYVYLSSGPYRTYEIGNRIIKFRTAAQSNFKVSEKSSMIIQALKTLGEVNITGRELMKISNCLTIEEKKRIKIEMKYAPIWMHEYLSKIGETPKNAQNVKSSIGFYR